jgi:6-pyruvoyltetrahydropterin/6-carboxytetrahydropterin synthase
VNGQHVIVVRHNFETAHRLPHLGGKCQNLHGHSWWAEVDLVGPMTDDGTVVEFSRVKAAIRGWIDGQLDHGAMLGRGDPLCHLLRDAGSKVFVFGEAKLAQDLVWPTVENVAVLITRAATLVLPSTPGLRVTRVRVTETHVNAAEYLS